MDIYCQNKGKENTMKKGLMTAILFGILGLFSGAHAQLIPAWTETAAPTAPIVVEATELAVARVVTTTRVTGRGSPDSLEVMQDTLEQVTALAMTLGQRCVSTTMNGGPASLPEMVRVLSAGGLEVPAGTTDLRVFRNGNTLKFSRAYSRGTISGECTLN